ncbi:MAG: hypothetical protein JSV46_04410, partial [Candidatus Aminicenantes bacterium]
MKKYILFLSIFSLLIFVSCGGGEKKTSTSPLEQDAQETEAQKPEAAEPDEAEHQDLRLSPQQQKEWGIVVGSTTRQDVASRITLPGILTLNQNKTAHISSLIGG